MGFIRSNTNSPPRTSHLDVSGRPPPPTYDDVVASGFGFRPQAVEVEDDSDDDTIMLEEDEIPPVYFSGDEEDAYTRGEEEDENPLPFPRLVSDEEYEDFVEPEQREVPDSPEQRGRAREGKRYVPFHNRKRKRKHKKRNVDKPTNKKVSEDTLEFREYLEDMGVDPGWLPQQLKKDLLAGRVTFKAMKRLASEDPKSKHIINKITCSQEIYEAGCSTLVRKACGMNVRKRVTEEEMNQPLHHIPKKVKTIQKMEYIREAAFKFFMDDQYSRCSPGKGDYVKVNGEKLQKRICNDYVRNLHTAFLAEHPDVDVCLSTFYECRPKQVLTSKYLTKDTTCCQKHQNFQLIVKALAKIIPNVKCVTSPDAFVEEYNTEEKIQQLLNTFDEEAHEGMVVYEKWGRVNDSDGKTKTRIIRVEEEPAEFIDNFMSRYLMFVDHNDRANHQYVQQRRCKQNLKPGECMVQVDFIQNYACLVQNAAQSSFFDQTQVTVHASVIYYREEENGELLHKSFVHASPVNTHNAAMVCAILDKLWTEDFREEKERLGIHTVHYYSDSPFSQYRNKWIFDFVTKHEERYGIKATWDYFETGHGKGPCDGVGGSVKRLADDAQKMGIRIQNAEDFVKWAQESRSVSYAVSYISQERFDQFKGEYDRMKPLLSSVKGTKKLHAVRPTRHPGVVEWRAVSCKCRPEDDCNCEWNEANIREPDPEEDVLNANGDTDIEVGDNVILEFQSNVYLALAKEPANNGYWDFKLYHRKGVHTSLQFQILRSGKRLIYPVGDILHKCRPLKSTRRNEDIKKLQKEDLAVFQGYIDLLMV